MFTCIATDNRGAVAYSDFVSIRTIRPDHLLVPLPLVDGTLQLCFCGETNQVYGVEASAELDAWQYLGLFVATNSILQYLNTTTANRPYRFYRAMDAPR